MDDPDREDDMPSYQDTGWDEGEISLASLRLDTSGSRNASAPNAGPDFLRARGYPRGELDTEILQTPDVSFPATFQPRPDYTFIETDGASMTPSLFGQGPQMPYSSRIVTDADSSRSNSPTEETSPLGSPSSKFEEIVANTPLDPSMPRFRDRRYTREDIDTDTFHGRLASFVVYNWRIPFMDKRLLAKQGFYYEGVEDEVICSGCDGSLRDWEFGDHPWREHRRNFQIDCFDYIEE